MTEYIFQIDNVSAGSTITISDAPTGLTAKNILAILNKTTAKPVHSPIADNIQSVSYSGTTLTITLKSGAPTIAGNLLIKAYKDGSDIDTTTLAKETSVKDGNDTAISVSKEIRSEVGTGSDTAAETGTLFAIVKWVKDKVKSIYNALTDNTNGLVAIKTETTAAKTAAQAVQTLVGSPASGQPSTLFAAIAAGGSGGGGTVYPTVQMTETTAAIDPNKVYIWGEVASLTITLNAGEQGVANVYFLEFYSGATATTLTLPASVTDIRGNIPANRIVNVAILNGVAYIA